MDANTVAIVAAVAFSGVGIILKWMGDEIKSLRAKVARLETALENCEKELKRAEDASRDLLIKLVASQGRAQHFEKKWRDAETSLRFGGKGHRPEAEQTP